MPRLDTEDRPVSRALLEAYIFALRFYEGLTAAESTHVTHYAQSEAERVRFNRLMEDPPLAGHMLEGDSQSDALIHKNSVVLSPRHVREELLEGINVLWQHRVSSWLETEDQIVLDIAHNDRCLQMEADLVFWAAGSQLPEAWTQTCLPVRLRAGQLECAKTDAHNGLAVSKGHYVIGGQGKTLFGATYKDSGKNAPPVSDAERQHNLEQLSDVSPEVFKDIQDLELISRTGIRATTNDNLPFVGCIPDAAKYTEKYGEDLRTGRQLESGPAPTLPCMMVCGGLGSRGLTWAPWLSQIALALVYGTPVSTEEAVLKVLSPARFLYRKLKRANLDQSD
jgi:tRNA 5-methylaminomethyl-2-thiouridine biosynthesis bifunctional protein